MELKSIRFALYFISLIFFMSCDSEEEKIVKYNSLMTQAEQSLNQGDNDAVLEYSKSALKIFKEKSLPNEYMANAYYNLDEVKKATKQAKIIIKKEGESSYGTKVLAFIDYYKKDKEKRALENAIVYYKAFPNDGGISYLLGSIYYNNKEYKNAIKHLTIALTQEYNPLESLEMRAYAYMKSSDLDRSIEDFNLLKNNSNASKAKEIEIVLAEIYQEKGDFETSNAIFKKSDSFNNDKAIAQNFIKLEMKDSALVYIKRYLASNPKDIEAHKYHYSILKSNNIPKENLLTYQKEINYLKWKEYNFFLKYLVFIILPFVVLVALSFIILGSVTEKPIYDTHNFKQGLPYVLLIPIGGAFSYTKNDVVILLNIIFFSALIVLVGNFYFFFGKEDYFVELLSNVLFFRIAAIYLIGIFIIDLVTLYYRVNLTNIDTRKRLDVEELKERLKDHNHTFQNVEELNKNLNHLFGK